MTVQAPQGTCPDCVNTRIQLTHLREEIEHVRNEHVQRLARTIDELRQARQENAALRDALSRHEWWRA